MLLTFAGAGLGSNRIRRGKECQEFSFAEWIRTSALGRHVKHVDMD